MVDEKELLQDREGEEEVGKPLPLRKITSDLLFTASGTLPLQIIKSGVPFASSVILSNYSKDVRSASLLIQTLTDFTSNVLNSPLNLLNTFVGKVNNAENKTKIGQVVQAGWLFALISSLPQVIILLFSKPILDAFGEAPEITSIVRDYFNLQIISIPFMCFWVACNKIAIGAEHVHFPVVTQLIGALGFASLIYPLTYGVGSLPDLGVKGAAVASDVNTALGVLSSLIGFAILSSKRSSLAEAGIFKFEFSLSKFRELFNSMKLMMQYGWQILLITASELGVLTLTNILVGSLSKDYLTPQLVINQYQDVTLIASSALGDAVQSRISNNIEKKPQNVRPYGNATLVLSTIVPAIYLVMSLAGPKLLMRPFIDPNDPKNHLDVQILDDQKLLFVSSINSVLMAIRYIGIFALFGAGEFNKALVLNMLTTWIGVGAGILVTQFVDSNAISGILAMNLGLTLGFFISAFGQTINWLIKSKRISNNVANSSVLFQAVDVHENEDSQRRSINAVPAADEEDGTTSYQQLASQ